MKTKLSCFMLLCLAVFILIQCEPPVVSGSISGTVKDAFTGTGVAGATVLVGDRSAVTDATGAFSLSYSPAASFTTNIFVSRGATYSFWGVYSVSIDPAANPQYTFFLIPYGAGSTVTISGALPGAAAATDRLQLMVRNSLGGMSYRTQTFSAGDTTYSITGNTTGTDCLIVAEYVPSPSSGMSAFKQYYSHQNLTSGLTLDITVLPTTAVTVTGTVGEYFGADLDFSFSDIPLYCFGGLAASPTTLDVYNPDNYPLIWKSAVVSDNTPVTDYQTIQFNIAPSSAFSSSVTLPGSTASVPAPTGVVTGTAWDAATRVLSFTGGAGATMHMCEFSADEGYIGFLLSASTSITLPLDFFANVIDPGTNWDVKVLPVYANKGIGNFVDMRLSDAGPMDVANAQISYVVGVEDPITHDPPPDNWPDLIP